MTVKELINHLQTLPQDVEVIYELYSDFAPMEMEQVKLVTAESKKIVLRKNPGYMRYYSGHWPKDGSEQPEFVTVVKFPGN